MPATVPAVSCLANFRPSESSCFSIHRRQLFDSSLSVSNEGDSALQIGRTDISRSHDGTEEIQDCVFHLGPNIGETRFRGKRSFFHSLTAHFSYYSGKTWGNWRASWPGFFVVEIVVLGEACLE